MRTYTVKPGDSISVIARDVLGDISLWPEIATINGLSNPYIIFPGQVLNLPEPQQATTPSSSDSNATSQTTANGGFPWGGFLVVAGLATGAYILVKKRKNKTVKTT